MIDRLGTRLFFYPRGPTFSMHWQTRGQLRSWRDINFTITSIIKRFPRKCSLRRTVQAGPILFCQVIGRLPRYVILKYFWNCWSLLPFDFLWILIPFRIVCNALTNHFKTLKRLELSCVAIFYRLRNNLDIKMHRTSFSNFSFHWSNVCSSSAVVQDFPALLALRDWKRKSRFASSCFHYCSALLISLQYKKLF